MNQNKRIIKLAKNCTFLNGLKFRDSNFCVKTMFLNSVLNRFDKYTRDEAAELLGVSKRTIASLEAGKVNNIVTILNYIHYFRYNFAEERQKENQRAYYKRKMKKLNLKK